MKLPLQISFHNMPRSEEIASLVEERAELLDNFAANIMSCRVVIDMPHRHHERGNQYRVRIDAKVPGEELVATREPDERSDYKDINIAIRDAFDALVRQLEDYVRRVRGATKTHQELPHARVEKLFPQAGYGFLSTIDGREIYFRTESVLPPGFARLEVGSEVTFVEEEGEKGPQASTVHVVGRHHRV